MQRQSSAPVRKTPTMRYVDSLARTPPGYWLAGSVGILLLDYVTGPFIQFPILFVVPVGIGTLSRGIRTGLAVAILLPLVRLSFFVVWPLPSSWLLESIDTAVDMIILASLAILVDMSARQQRQLRILEGMLPICSFCKRIRDEHGEWRSLELFIADRSEARFSHTFCETCGRIHYPDLVD
jgi:hypothetical protein